jgi:putative nucleotidyltransferase with HDIG domain
LGRSISTNEAKKMVANMVESIIRNPDAMVVLSQLKNVDEYTALHSLRVCILAVTFGRHLDMSREELNLLGIGALLHDVGKMKVPLDVLNKPGKLSDVEFEIMKSHVTEGVKIVEMAHGIAPASLEVVRTHHERYAGGGYASGLAGDDIHPFGLIASIVDCYDAITSDRVYQKGISPQDALSKMYEWRTSDFHPTLVEQFIQCMGIYPIGSVVELSDGSIGVVGTVNRERRLLPKVVQVQDRHHKPIAPPKILDLHYEYERTKKGHVCIRKVLPPGTHGVWPVDHLPLRG